MNYSTWDKLKSGEKRSNPALSPGHIIVEFDRTKRQKIFSHKLGSVDFSNLRELNAPRQRVIDREIVNVTPQTGFKYPVVGYVHSSNTITKKNESTGRYEVLAHGHPLGGTTREQFESCTKSGLVCSEGQGTNSLCSPGKCVIGYLQKITERKWKYTSYNSYNGDGTKVTYFVPADKTIRLKTILRGKVKTLTSDNSSVAVANVNKPASVASTIHLPAKFYFFDEFLDTTIIESDDRLRDLVLSPSTITSGIKDRKSEFVRRIALKAYPVGSEEFVSSSLALAPSAIVKETLLSEFSSAPEPWQTYCSTIITYNYALYDTNLEYISGAYDRISELFDCIIQSLPSSLSQPKISYSKDTIARPVYSRLPGLSEGYRSDPAFSDVETPAQWMISGVDEFLSNKKEEIASFYANYLDPETCTSGVLDWLAQHLGLFGSLWNEEWTEDIKRTLIRNAFGWWERESEITYPQGQIKTLKGQALDKYPFTNSEWVSTTEQNNLLSIKLDEIETLRLTTTNQLWSFDKFKAKTYSSNTNSVVLSALTSPKINKNLWNGLIESKGSLLGVEFLCSTLGIKSHLPTELTFKNSRDFSPRSGLREEEINAPIQVPYKYDVIQVGSEKDASFGNFTNQLIAGVSRAASIEESKKVFFRMPFYYNRDGRSWDKMEYIAKNWMPSNLSVRIQYPYLSADLWAVGDAFFQPEIITETPSSESQAFITTEDGQTYTTTEEGAPILYD